MKQIIVVTVSLALLTMVGCTQNEPDSQPLKQPPVVDLKVVQKHFPDVAVVMDRHTGIPARLTGLKYQSEALAKIKAPISAEKVQSFFKTFLDENKAVLTIDSTNLKLVSKTLRKGRWFVKYQQTFKGIPILDSTVGLVGSENGKVLSLNASYVPGLELDVKEKFSVEKAEAIAKAAYSIDVMKTMSVRKIDKVIAGIGKGKDRKFHLAWRVDMVAQKDRVENDKIFIIDAATGKILKSYPSRFYGSYARGRLQGEIYPENPTDTVSPEHLSDTRINGNGVLWNKNTHTGGDGRWGINTPWWTSWWPNYLATAQLIGPFAQVQDSAGNDYTLTQNCSVNNDCNMTWNSADEDHTNVFYHINIMHDWYQDQLSYSWTNPWTSTSRFNAEVNHSYSNAHAGDPMGYGTDDFARSSDVIYHECTHNLLYALFGDWVGFSVGQLTEGYAFDEGFSDYFAGSITEDPIHGEGYGGSRSLDEASPRQYTGKASYNTEGHTGGTIIAGAAWNIRESFRTRYGAGPGARAADNLMFDALIAMAAFPNDYYFSDPQESNFLHALYLADDANNDLLDGVPHFFDIHDAFARHNMLQAELLNGDSYDVSTNTLGSFTGGDFYFYQDAFWSNNLKQRGVKDLGDIGNVDLEDVIIPGTGYTRQRVNAVEDHTYVALAQVGEEAHYIVFRVTEMDATADRAVIEYRYRNLLTFNPDWFCNRFRQFCRGIYPCDRYPILCHRDYIVPIEDGIIFEFEEVMDHVVIPLDRICRYVIDCPGCGPNGLCLGYDLEFREMPEAFGLTIYDNQGRIVAQDAGKERFKHLKFDTRRGATYFLVITPTKQTKMKVKYKLPINFRSSR